MHTIHIASLVVYFASLLFISAVLSQQVKDGVENEGGSFERITINGISFNAPIQPWATYNRLLNNKIAIKSFSISNSDVECFFRKHPSSSINNRNDQASFVSRISNSLTFSSPEEHFWDSLVCVVPVPDKPMIILEHSRDNWMDFDVFSAGERLSNGAFMAIIPDDRVKDVTRMALIKAPDPSTICSVSGFGKMSALVSLERPYTSGAILPAVKYILCQVRGRDPIHVIGL